MYTLRTGFRFWDAVMTLSICFVTGDSWNLILAPLMLRSVTAVSIIVPTYVIVNIGLLNTVSAVIVDKQVSAHKNDCEFLMELQQQGLLQSFTYLQDLFQKSSGGASLADIHAFYESSEDFRQMMHSLDIDKRHLNVLFAMLDADESGSLDLLEFVNGIHQLKHENLHTIAVLTKHYTECLFHRTDEIEVSLRENRVFSRDLYEALQAVEESLGRICTAQNIEHHRHAPASPLSRPARQSSVGSGYESRASSFSRPPDPRHRSDVSSTEWSDLATAIRHEEEEAAVAEKLPPVGLPCEYSMCNKESGQ